MQVFINASDKAVFVFNGKHEAMFYKDLPHLTHVARLVDSSRLADVVRERALVSSVSTIPSMLPSPKGRKKLKKGDVVSYAGRLGVITTVLRQSDSRYFSFCVTFYGMLGSYIRYCRSRELKLVIPA